ncbi:hypothetical protein F5Y03DRAFT_309886 [Xylaria venustula]|nr:hypothetical protein F5Y03DRAFT_309886 [Xylaria venustula]
MTRGPVSERTALRGAASSRSCDDRITWSAGAALVFGVVVCHSSSQQSELTSELVCWTLLPVLFQIAKRRRNPDEKIEAFLLSVHNLVEPNKNENPSSISLWIVAISLVICSLFRAENRIFILLPALIPLLNIGHRFLRPGLLPPAACHMSFFPLLTHNLIGSILAAIFAILALSEWEPTLCPLSVAPVAALFVVYTLLTPPNGQSSQWLRSIDIRAASWSLSLRVVILLAVVLGKESYTIGFPSTNALGTLFLGSVKAFMWYLTSQLVCAPFLLASRDTDKFQARNCSWLAAAVAGTFSLLATRNPFTQQTDARALVTVTASLISLGQMVYLLPKQAKARLALWALAAIPLLPYLSNLAAIRLAQTSAIIDIEKHPVEILIHEANANFDRLLGNQSNTFPAAYAEYQRRYGFDPPRGFEDWYKFAQSHESPIIDEFDIITEGVAPFFRLSGKEVVEAMSLVYDEPGHDLWQCTMFGQPAKTKCSQHESENDRWTAFVFDKIAEKIPSTLNLKFLHNPLDEPSVLIPPLSQKPAKPIMTNLQGQHAWGILTKYCSSRERRTSVKRTSQIETYGLPFVTDHKSALDVCAHPEYNESHGILTSPASLLLIEALVPVLSTGAPTVMGDILYPSWAYVYDPRFRYEEDHDVEWEEKRNNLYWAGSTTGGFSHPGQWQNLQRHRFVELAQNLKHRSFSYLREKGGIISRVASSFLNGRLYDVAFTSVLQCETKACKEQHQYFVTKPWASRDQPYHSRLVFDVDGNGISGRYYKLLASRSLPLKQTIIREWHDERLLPWVHYIPVSQSLEELPELVFYLTSTENGQKRAKEIAENGHRWYSQALREIDVVIYMYRLFLELQRLQDPERPAWPKAVDSGAPGSG